MFQSEIFTWLAGKDMGKTKRGSKLRSWDVEEAKDKEAKFLRTCPCKVKLEVSSLPLLMQNVPGWEVAETGGGRWREGQVAEMWCRAEDPETEGDSFWYLLYNYADIQLSFFQVSIPAM